MTVCNTYDQRLEKELFFFPFAPLWNDLYSTKNWQQSYSLPAKCQILTWKVPSQLTRNFPQKAKKPSCEKRPCSYRKLEQFVAHWQPSFSKQGGGLRSADDLVAWELENKLLLSDWNILVALDWLFPSQKRISLNHKKIYAPVKNLSNASSKTQNERKTAKPWRRRWTTGPNRIFCLGVTASHMLICNDWQIKCLAQGEEDSCLLVVAMDRNLCPEIFSKGYQAVWATRKTGLGKESSHNLKI